jgi:hypothetical protein
MRVDSAHVKKALMAIQNYFFSKGFTLKKQLILWITIGHLYSLTGLEMISLPGFLMMLG